MIGKEPIDSPLDAGASVTLLRRDTWDRVNSKPKNSLKHGKDTDWWELMVHQYKFTGNA